MDNQPQPSTGSDHEPIFEHDHEGCVFLGPAFGGPRAFADLYFCEQGGTRPTVIARFSHEGSDYTSGLVAADHDPYLREAKRRAEDRGLLSPPLNPTTAEMDAMRGWPRATIYGNYVAPAVSSRGGGAWHIQGDEPDLALCGKRLVGDLSRMDLHVSLLECFRCMALGESVFSTPPVERNADDG